MVNFVKIRKLEEIEFTSIEKFDEMYKQRDELFKGFICAQKLALANTKNNFHKTEQKALSRMQENG